jgi:hypothetical protein
MGQKSAVDKLPEKLRKKLIALLQDPAVTQAAIAEAINYEAGEQLISTSSVNRYAKRMKKFAEKSRQAREVTEAYLAKCGGDNRINLGKVINEQIRLAVYDLMIELEDIKDGGEIDASGIAELLHKVSRSLNELEKAEKLNAERTEAIRKAALAEAAETVETTAKASGLSAQAVDTIKQKILGL